MLPRRVTPIGDPGTRVSRQDRHQGIHDRMGMQRIRWEGDGGCTGAGAVEREEEVGQVCLPGACGRTELC